MRDGWLTYDEVCDMLFKRNEFDFFGASMDDMKSELRAVVKLVECGMLNAHMRHPSVDTRKYVFRAHAYVYKLADNVTAESLRATVQLMAIGDPP